MPKYRLLDTEELTAFEKEFVEFLVINGITVDDWIKMKDNEPEKTANIITLFSDVIFEKLMRQTQYIIQRSRDRISCFHYQAEQAILVGIETDDDTIDLLKMNNNTIPTAGVSIFSTTKKYTKQRELELFEMIQSGAEISDGSLYKAICLGLS